MTRKNVKDSLCNEEAAAMLHTKIWCVTFETKLVLKFRKRLESGVWPQTVQCSLMLTILAAAHSKTAVYHINKKKCLNSVSAFTLPPLPAPAPLCSVVAISGAINVGTLSLTLTLTHPIIQFSSSHKKSLPFNTSDGCLQLFVEGIGGWSTLLLISGV